MVLSDVLEAGMTGGRTDFSRGFCILIVKHESRQ